MYPEHRRYTWRHDSVHYFIAKSLSVLPACPLYADLATILSPFVITGNSLLINDSIVFILELTIDFETNIINSDRKASKCYLLRQTLLSKYDKSIFINLSLGVVGTIGSSSESSVKLLNFLGFDDNSQKHILSQLVNIIIRYAYSIFCCHNKPWTNLD